MVSSKWKCISEEELMVGRPALLATMLCIFAASSACGKEGEPAPPPAPVPVAVASVELLPQDVELIVGAVLRLQALPTDEHGEDLSGREATWFVSDESIARIDSHGLVEGLAPGMTIVTVTVEGVSASTLLRVLSPPVGRVLITPDVIELIAGETITLEATVFNVWGAELADVEILWSSSAPEIAAIDEGGAAHALVAGGATIIAEAEGVRGSASVTVHAVPIEGVIPEQEELELHAGRERQLHAAAVDAKGSPIPDVEVYWSSDDPQIATVDSDGILRAWRPGEITITAHAGTRKAEIQVRVLPMTVLRIELQPTEALVLVGEELSLSAIVIGVDEEPLFGRTINWISSDESLATVDSRGFVQTLAPGLVTITAAVGDVMASSTLTLYVPPPLIGSISFPPMTNILLKGDSLVLEPIVLDIDDVPIKAEGLVWSSSDDAIATVDEDGVVAGVGQGNTTIKVSFDGIAATTAVFVFDISHISFTPQPPIAPLLLGQSMSFNARAVDTTGLAVPWPVEARSSDEGVVVIDGNLMRAVAVGEATIRASLLDISAEFVVEVVQLPKFKTVFGGPTGNCALTSGGEVYCWGRVANGIISSIHPMRLETPAPVREVSIGASHLCVVTMEGEGYCRGAGRYGQLGDGGIGNTNHFARVMEGLELRTIQAGSAYSCAATVEGEGYCWGTSTALGIGAFDAYPLSPVSIEGDIVFESLHITAGGDSDFYNSTCGISSAGRGYCWGTNLSGELGNSSSRLWSSVPSLIAGDLVFSDLDVSNQVVYYDPPIPGDPPRSDWTYGHGCGVAQGGEGYCWGANDTGELGNGTTVSSRVPIPIETGESFSSVEVRARVLSSSRAGNTPASFSCGITVEGRALCWGANGAGQLGNGTDLSTTVPTTVAGDLRFGSIALGDMHVCGITTDGFIYCWGSNPYGLGGLGSTQYAPVPAIGQPGATKP